MTTTITPPAPYSSVRKPVLFTIDRTPGTVCEVSINGYRKLLTDGMRSVNVAHYYESDFDIRPEIAPGEMWKVFDGRETRRVIDAVVQADGVTSESVPLVSADAQPSPDRFMSDLRRRMAAAGEVDEIPVWLTQPAVLAYGDERLSLTEGVSFVAFRIPEAAPARFEVSLLTTEGELLDRIDYELTAGGGVRMAWVNALGAVDCWTFENRQKATMKITKTQIYAERGYVPTSIQAETTYTVCSQALSEQVLEVLGRVFVSERVWVMAEAEIREVDVVSDTATLYEAERPSLIQVEYKNSKRQL